jgi:hypothetical protein
MDIRPFQGIHCFTAEAIKILAMKRPSWLTHLSSNRIEDINGVIT